MRLDDERPDGGNLHTEILLHIVGSLQDEVHRHFLGLEAEHVLECLARERHREAHTVVSTQGGAFGLHPTRLAAIGIFDGFRINADFVVQRIKQPAVAQISVLATLTISM